MNEQIRVAAFSPHSKPKRFLCLAMRAEGRIAIRAFEAWGTVNNPFDPYKILERLRMLESRGFYILTDSQHELWEQFPSLDMQSRTYSHYINRDYALDQLVEYYQSDNLALPTDQQGIVPSPLDYRRQGSGSGVQPYEFRNYRAELHVLLIATLGLLHPPSLSETWINTYFDELPSTERVEENRLKNFERITVQLDQEISQNLAKD